MLTPNFITRDDVLLIHADQIESFGGTLGLRDEGLLESALAQPKASFAGELLHKTIAEQAAAYLYHLAMNTALVAGCEVFLANDVELRRVTEVKIIVVSELEV